MFAGRGRRTLLAAGLGLALAVTVAGPASAATHDIVFKKSEACTFALGIDITAVGTNAERVTQDRSGRIISAGTGLALTFTNVRTGAQVSFTSNGAVTIDQPVGNGITIKTLTGHNVVILGPGDTPAGPSTTLFTGQVVIRVVDATSQFTVLSSSGTSVDICAAVS
jgi:hypothetical protein